MSFKKFSKITSYFFVIVSALGCIPWLIEKEQLFGIFHINNAHHIIYLLTGLSAYGASRKTPAKIKLFFQIIGLIYLTLALIGFYSGDKPIFGFLYSLTQ